MFVGKISLRKRHSDDEIGQGNPTKQNTVKQEASFHRST
jgi:hypothetical protein